MEWPAGYTKLGHASCGHMDKIAHGNYHDAGHNGNGRAPDSDCMSEVDIKQHPLGGPWRFAVYAPAQEASCLRSSLGAPTTFGASSIAQCAPPGYKTANNAQWMYVGCFVSAKGGTQGDPWSDGERWKDDTWDGCKARAIYENTFMFALQEPGTYETANHAKCGHMKTIMHGNYADKGHNGAGRAPDKDCMAELDATGHALGGKDRFAIYAPHDVASCVNDCADATCKKGSKH